jgi:hypothetical protein
MNKFPILLPVKDQQPTEYPGSVLKAVDLKHPNESTKKHRPSLDINKDMEWDDLSSQHVVRTAR